MSAYPGWLILVTCWALSQSTAAQEPPVPKHVVDRVKTGKAVGKKASKALLGRKVERLPFTPEHEAEALEFVERYHSELTEVLRQLKHVQQPEYEKAIGELAHIAQQLANLQVKDPTRYPMALEAWKLKSRIELATARLTEEPDAVAKEQLRRYLRRQIEVQIAELQLEVDRLKARTAKLEASILAMTQNRDRHAEERLARLTQMKKRFDDQRRKEPKRRKTAEPAGGTATPTKGASDAKKDP